MKRVIKRIVKNLWKIKNFFANLIFPVYCVGCGKEGKNLCPDCLNKIPLAKSFICLVCHQPSFGGKVCQNCRRKTNLAGLVFAFSYQEPLIKEVISVLKYEKVYHLAKPLTRLLIDLIKNSDFFMINFSSPVSSNNNFLVVPIPLYKTKFLERGFNQAELIGQEIAQKFGLKLENNLLVRIKNTLSQTDLKGEKRFLNVENAFQIKKPRERDIKGKIIFLIDDVVTTGATLNEAAKVLRKAGAKEIWGLVIAKG